MDDHGGRAGLEALAGRLYARGRGRLLAIARQNSDRPEDAEDAVNEGFCLFLGKFDAARFREPVAWLTNTLKRVCWSSARRGQVRHERPEFGHDLERRIAGGADPEQRVETMALAAEVRAAMELLKPQERRVFGLLAFGYSYREIMALTGWSYTKVKLWRRAGQPGYWAGDVAG